MGQPETARLQKRLENALNKVGMLIEDGGFVYVPIFERLQAELDALTCTTPAQRARMLIKSMERV